MFIRVVIIINRGQLKGKPLYQEGLFWPPIKETHQINLSKQRMHSLPKWNSQLTWVQNQLDSSGQMMSSKILQLFIPLSSEIFSRPSVSIPGQRELLCLNGWSVNPGEGSYWSSLSPGHPSTNHCRHSNTVLWLARSQSHTHTLGWGGSTCSEEGSPHSQRKSGGWRKSGGKDAVLIKTNDGASLVAQ